MGVGCPIVFWVAFDAVIPAKAASREGAGYRVKHVMTKFEMHMQMISLSTLFGMR